MAEREKLIEVKDLQISFGKGRKKFVAVDHVNFDIYKGETFSLVGESGSGKTTIGRAIIRINETEKTVTSFSFRLRYGSTCAKQWIDGYASEPFCEDGEYRNRCRTLDGWILGRSFSGI